MSCKSRLDKAFAGAPVLPLDAGSRYVLFSDCHRGNGTQGDNFLKNQHLYLAALNHYYKCGYTYIELGDGDELWENRKIEQIKEIHTEVFCLLARFYQQQRLYMIYGNHDMVKKYPTYAEKKCVHYPCLTSQETQPLFPGIRYHAGIILQDPSGTNSLYLTHGHQASLLNSTLWPLGCFLVRHLWKPLELLGVLDPTSAAKNYTTKQRFEYRLSDWAHSRQHILITGHTHRPMLSDSSPMYINTGSCVHPRCITCLEIHHHRLDLVKWLMGTRDNGNFYLQREELSTRELPS